MEQHSSVMVGGIKWAGRITRNMALNVVSAMSIFLRERIAVCSTQGIHISFQSTGMSFEMKSRVGKAEVEGMEVEDMIVHSDRGIGFETDVALGMGQWEFVLWEMFVVGIARSMGRPIFL